VRKKAARDAEGVLRVVENTGSAGTLGQRRHRPAAETAPPPQPRK